MKKIITVFVIMLAFGLTAKAQQKATGSVAQQQEITAKRAAITEGATKDIATLSNYVKLTSDQKVKLNTLFTEKHRMRLDTSLSAERKSVAAKSIEASFKSTLTPDQLSKVEGNAELMKTLINI